MNLACRKTYLGYLRPPAREQTMSLEEYTDGDEN
jgi:hypothetical protein